MRQRLPLVLSATALFIAVAGSTSLGQAAGNAAGKTFQKAKATAGFGPSAAKVRRGPRGPRGRRGPVGPAGPEGPPGADGTAFAEAVQAGNRGAVSRLSAAIKADASAGSIDQAGVAGWVKQHFEAIRRKFDTEVAKASG